MLTTFSPIPSHSAARQHDNEPTFTSRLVLSRKMFSLKHLSPFRDGVEYTCYIRVSLLLPSPLIVESIQDPQYAKCYEEPVLRIATALSETCLPS